MSFIRSMCGISLVAAVAATSSFGCSSSDGGGGSAQSQASLCASGCQKGAQVCGAGFDEKACEQQCNASPSSPSNAKVPDACKSQLDAYARCAQNATYVCPDGQTPQMQGCDAEMNAFGQCMASNSGAPDTGTSSGDDSGSWFDEDAW